MKQNLPGLPTIAALMLTAILATWLCLAGLPNLKDWQTLTASCIALVGGTLAYRGAMAKVDFDRKQSLSQLKRERSALFLKLRMALAIHRNEVDRQRSWIDVPRGAGERSVSPRDFSFEELAELEEAWGKLYFFAPDTVHALATIKSHQRVLWDAVEVFEEVDQKWKYNCFNIPDDIQSVIKTLRDLGSHCIDAVTKLDRDMKSESGEH